MKTICHTATLFYYDGPQVFEARDTIGGHYIALLVDIESSRYLVAGVAPESLRQFRAGMMDLRSLLEEGGAAEWFLATDREGLGKPLELEAQSASISESGLLPDAGFLLHDCPTESEVLRESRERNNLVLEVSVEPPESAGEHRIRVGTLIGLLGHVQAVVKHAYNTALRDLSQKIRRNIDRFDAHVLDVVIPAAPGSFRILLEAAQRRSDLLGQNELGRALQLLDLFFENADAPEKVIATVKAHRGHLAGAYLRLLTFLATSKTGLRYAWAEPMLPNPITRTITGPQVGPLVDALSGVANLGGESVVLVGALEKADVVRNVWRIKTEDGVVSGKIREGGPTLAGLKMHSAYRFSCMEEIEEVEGTGREKRTLYLVEHEPV